MIDSSSGPEATRGMITTADTLMDPGKSKFAFGSVIGTPTHCSALPDLVQCVMTMKTLRKFNGRDTCCFFLTVQLVTLLLLHFFITLHAREDLTFCRDFNYTEGSKGSKYGSNLNTVFNSLVEHTSETGFNSSMDGQSPDTAYGLLQCFADATADQCKNCSQSAIRQNQIGCGTAVGGRILMDACYLRYENYSFIGELDTNYTWCYNEKNTSNPDDFKAHLKNLLSKLSAEAAREGYASGTTEDSFFPKIYALVMCTTDISNDDCTDCLSLGNNLAYEQFYPPREGAKIMLGSCIVRYEIYSFFNSTKIDHSNTSNKKTIIVAVSGGLLLAVLSVCVFAYIGRRLKSGVFRREYEDRPRILQRSSRKVMDEAQDKASQATKATKGMGQLDMDTAHQGAGANKGMGQSVMDTTRQGAGTNKGMGQSIMDTARHGAVATKGVATKGMAQSATEQTGSYLQQAGDTVMSASQSVGGKVKGATQTVIDTVKSPFVGK